MKEGKFRLIGTIIVITAIVFSMTACKGDEDLIEKTLVITNIPGEVLPADFREKDGELGLFPVGTTKEQALAMEGLVTGAFMNQGNLLRVGPDPYTLTIPLFFKFTNTRWTESGTFAIYAQFTDPGKFWRLSSVKINSEMTIVDFTHFVEVTFP